MITTLINTESELPAWQQEFKGLHWQDMPGPTDEDRKMNFFLFRRGRYDPAMDVVEPDAVELQETEDEMQVDGTGWRRLKHGRKFKRTRTGKLVLRTKRSAAQGNYHAQCRKLACQKAWARRREKEQEEETQAHQEWSDRLKEACAALTPSQCNLIRKRGGAGLYSAVKRLLGLDVSRGEVKRFEEKTLIAIGSMLDALPGWEGTAEAEIAQRKARKEGVRQRIQALLAGGAVHVLTRLERLSGYNYRYLQRLMAGNETLVAETVLDTLEAAVAKLEENPALVVPKPESGLKENATSTPKERKAA